MTDALQERAHTVLAKWQNEVDEHGRWTSGHSIADQMAKLVRDLLAALDQERAKNTYLEYESDRLARILDGLYQELTPLRDQLAEARSALQAIDVLVEAMREDDYRIGGPYERLKKLLALASPARPQESKP